MAGDTANEQYVLLLFLGIVLEEVVDCELGRSDRMDEVDVDDSVAARAEDIRAWGCSRGKPKRRLWLYFYYKFRVSILYRKVLTGSNTPAPGHTISTSPKFSSAVSKAR